MPFFSVIIPLYNKEKYIKETLQSVLNQYFEDFEVIIVNDGSTDKSMDIVTQFKDSRVQVVNQTNQGVSAARNNGIFKAKTEFIAFLDADDLWYKNHLTELKKQITNHPKAGLFCNNYEVYYSEDFKIPAKINLKCKNECILVDDFFKASIVNPVAWTSAVCIPKSIFNSIGKFNTNYKTAQDLDLWIRIALKYKVSFNPKTTMSYKRHVEKSLSKNEFNTIRADFISSFKEEEKKNKSLKLYLDINRYALALRSKMNNELEIYNRMTSEIDYKNLNLKQRIILKSPKIAIKLIKRVQKFLIKNNTYFSAH